MLDLQSLAPQRRSHERLALVALLLSAAAAGCGGPSDTTPVPCVEGTFDPDGDPSTGCVAFTECTAGQFVSAEGTPLTDRVCTPCGSSTFSVTSNASACTAWSDCAAGAYVSAAGTASSDRECSACPAGSITSGENQSMCLAANDCAAGTVQTVPGTTTTPPVCEDCVAGQHCPGGDAPAVACTDSDDTWDDDADPATACVPRSVCGVGTRVVAMGSAIGDRACTDCSVGTFSTEPNAPSCGAWRDCTAGTFVANTPTTSADRVCTACAGGSYTSGNNQAMCVPVGSCAPGTVQTAPGAGSLPPTCAVCTPGQYCAGSVAPAVTCGVSSDWDHDGDPSTPCGARSNCAAGYRVASAGSSTTNRTCAACTGETFSTTVNALMCTPWRTCGSGMEASPGSNTMDRTCQVAGWVRQFGGGADTSDYAVATNANADVFFAGSVNEELPGQTALGNTDMFLRKYDSGGNLIWTRQFGTAEEDVGSAVTVASNGNVIVTGYTAGALPGFTNASEYDWDVAVFAFSADGTPLWAHQFGSVESDYGFAVTTDATHNVFVGGCTWGALPGQSHGGRDDTYVAKLDVDGDLLWTRQLGGTSDDCAVSIATSPDGSVSITGATYGDLPGETSLGQTDMFIIQYDTDGDLLRSNHIGTTEWEEAAAIVSDALGNLYIAGLTDRVDPGFVTHALVEKYASDGALLWSRTFGVEDLQHATALGVDAAGNVYVGGNVVETGTVGEPGTNLEDVFVATYDSEGTAGWSRRFGTVFDDYLTSVAVSSGGVLYVGGFTYGTFPGQPPVMYGDAFVSLVTPP
jgi:hypothetical protein